MTRLLRSGLGGLAALAVGLFVAWRLADSLHVGVDYFLMFASVAAFLALMAVLAALKVGQLTWVVYGYLATPFFANRLLGEAWLGSPDERAAGTVAPFLMGDLVLVFVLVRQRRRLPAWLFLAAAILLLPFLAVLTTGRLDTGAFLYQYAAIVRALVVAWFARRAFVEDGRTAAIDALVLNLGIIFGTMALATSAAALVTGSRGSMPGWGANVFANALCVVGFLCVATVLHRRVVGRGRRALLWLAAVACLAGIVSTGTRVALVLYLVAFLAVVVVRVVPRRLRFVALPILAAVAVALFAAVPGVLLEVVAEVSPRAQSVGGVTIDRTVTLPRLVEAVGRESSVRTRLALWRASLGMAQAYPVTGVGWGQWNWSKDRFGIDLDVLLDPHNGYMWLVAESGIAITLLALLALARLLFRAPFSRPYLAFCLILLLEVTNSNVQKPLYGVLVGVVVGSMLAYRRRLLEAPASSRQRTRPRSSAGRLGT